MLYLNISTKVISFTLMNFGMLVSQYMKKGSSTEYPGFTYLRNTKSLYPNYSLIPK